MDEDGLMFTEIEFRNAKPNDSGGIDCEVKFKGTDWLPFTARPDDVEEHGRQVYAAAVAK